MKAIQCPFVTQSGHQMGFRERACCFPPRLGHFLRWFRFWRSYYAGPNSGPRSVLKPNPTQARVLFAHALVGSSAGPCEAFFSPFPIVGGGRHRFVPAWPIKRLRNASQFASPIQARRCPRHQDDENAYCDVIGSDRKGIRVHAAT
jgi:hypothetical protein